MSEHDNWQAGKAAMDAVYGDGFTKDYADRPEGRPFQRDTVEHLFAEIWQRPGLSVRDRRLLVIGATAALGRADLVKIQALGALRNGELDATQLQEAELQLAYYTGWGNATSVVAGIAGAIGDFEEESGHGTTQADGTAQDRATTDDAKGDRS